MENKEDIDSEPKILSIDQVPQVLIPLLEPLSKATVVFEGFTLPQDFGESNQLQYGDIRKSRAKGLGIGAVEMGKSFVFKTIEELFSGELGDFVPEGTLFRLSQEGNEVFVLTALR